MNEALPSGVQFRESSIHGVYIESATPALKNKRLIRSFSFTAAVMEVGVSDIFRTFSLSLDGESCAQLLESLSIFILAGRSLHRARRS
jgi:hypothetical protein